MKTINEYANLILKKGAEFFMCARHLHLRGAGEVVEETKAIVKEMKEAGHTFDALLDAIVVETKNSFPLEEIRKDLFIGLVQKMFDGLPCDISEALPRLKKDSHEQG